MFVIGMLSQKGDGALCIVDIELRHVEIIDEIDEFLFAGWTKLFTCDFLKELFQLNLKIA